MFTDQVKSQEEHSESRLQSKSFNKKCHESQSSTHSPTHSFTHSPTLKCYQYMNFKHMWKQKDSWTLQEGKVALDHKNSSFLLQDFEG